MVKSKCLPGPAINVTESEKAYKVELAAPGMTTKISTRIDEEKQPGNFNGKKTETKEEKRRSLSAP